MKNFAAPQESLGNLNAEAAARLIATAADIAIVVDEDGMIRDTRDAGYFDAASN